MSNDKEQLEALAANLYARRGEGVLVPRVDVKIGEWVPQNGYCHGNVMTWLEHHPKHRAVRGWVLADYLAVGFVRFFSHSVIETEDGALMDITPNAAPWQYLFIRHAGSEDSYAEIVEGDSIVSIDFQPR
jgi:hypothetical protein